MKKQEFDQFPFIPATREFYDFVREQNKFDPMGSYTGRPQGRKELPIQDVDDL